MPSRVGKRWSGILAINGGGIKPYAAASMEKAAAFWPKNWFGQWAAVLLLLKIKMRKCQYCLWAMGGGFATAQDKNEKTSMLLLGNGRRLFDFLLQIIKKDGIEKFA